MDVLLLVSYAGSIGTLAIYSLRRNPDQFNYSGNLVFGGKRGQRWTINQALVTISLNPVRLAGTVSPNPIGNAIISPRIHRLPGLVITKP